jgi:putative CocE/NonD family hydrolase
MKIMKRTTATGLLCLLAMTCALSAPKPAAPAYPSETPPHFTQNVESFDYVKREVMIPMRDGVKLKTFILIPKGAHNAPLLMTRTPYDAAARVMHFDSPHLAAAVPQMDDTAVAAGYIIVYQDVRGKYGSEGDYIMTRPLAGAVNPTTIDYATDTYDTIDWLVTHVPESNGRVGTIGGSYEGYTTLMSTVHPHPALKVAIPFAPMVDGWIGDDWFHNGAFRQDGSLDYILEQEGAREGQLWWSGQRDTYQAYLDAGSAAAMAATHGLEQLGYWQKLVAHTAYDSFWQDQAVDKLLAHEPLSVPLLIVCGLFDQEDIYGGPAVFKALAPKDPKGERVHLVLGPWNHGGGRQSGRAVGSFTFAGDTAIWFRQTVMQPFLDYYLKDGPKPQTPRVLVYETGANGWNRYDSWPRSCAQGCAETSRNLYLLAGGRLGFSPPESGSGEFDEYVSDPAKPVPYRSSRPTLLVDLPDSTWGEWLMDDQRNAASRPDVAVFRTEPLTQPVRVAGQPMADLFASTSGTDSDWVVKLIDVWPDEVPEQPALGGYEQMIAADIFRGRYREDLAVAHPLTPNEPLPYRIRLPNVSHTFLPGHRIMVQVQSSWFPLYDRNPQRFVPNIMFAAPLDFTKATQRIWHSVSTASLIELPVIAPSGESITH